MSKEAVILFDGVCNYCNRMVNFAMRNDPKGHLRFAAIQSAAGQQLLKRRQAPTDVNSVVLIEGERIFYYSTAAIRIARYLRWPAKLLYALIVVPRFIREPIYKWISRNRYRWFGKKESCRIPTEKEKSRFLSDSF